MMGKMLRHAADAEIAILKHLWKVGPATARSIAEYVYQSATASNIATVQKLLQRLEDKGLVRRERKPPAHVFAAAVSQEQFAGEQLEVLAEKVSGGSLAPFVMHLVNARRLSQRERAEIRKLLSAD